MSGAWQEFERESRDSSRRLLVLGAVLAVALLAGLQFLGGGLRSGGTASPAAPARMEAEAEPRVRIESMTEVDPPVPAGPSAASSSRGGSQSYVGVYECVVNGQRVVSDHPCGADAQARMLVVDQPDPRDVARQQQRTWAAQAPSAPRAPSVPRTSGAGPATAAASAVPANVDACAAVDREIAALNARMRQRYDSQEGEWLRARWHDLQKRREALDCGRR
jgi:hypothetical protein